MSTFQTREEFIARVKSQLETFNNQWDKAEIAAQVAKAKLKTDYQALQKHMKKIETHLEQARDAGDDLLQEIQGKAREDLDIVENLAKELIEKLDD